MKSNQDGFTLLEILASVVILGILLTVFFQLFIFSQKTTTTNQEKLEEINIAETVLEKIKNRDEDIKISGPGMFKRYYDKESDKIFREDEEGYDKDFHILIEVIEKELGLYSVEITVTGNQTHCFLEGLVNL